MRTRPGYKGGIPVLCSLAAMRFVPGRDVRISTEYMLRQVWRSRRGGHGGWFRLGIGDAEDDALVIQMSLVMAGARAGDAYALSFDVLADLRTGLPRHSAPAAT